MGRACVRRPAALRTAFVQGIDGGRRGVDARERMHSTDVVHALAVLTIAMLVARGLMAIAEHYFPDSEGVAAARFIYGGP